MRIPFFTHRVSALALAIPACLLSSSGCGNSTTGPQNTTPTATGSLTITAATTGKDQDSAYVVSVDGEAHGTVTANGTLKVDSLTVGDHKVTLAGFTENCGEDSAGSRTATVAANQATTVAFNVTCVANVGTLRIITNTDGPMIDPDGYQIVADTETVAVNPTDTVMADIKPGSINITLTGQAANCTPHGSPQRSANLAFRDTLDLTFAVTCFQDPIVFERRDTTYRQDLYVVDASGGTEVRLTDDVSTFVSYLASPAQGSAWDPTKTHIAFASAAEQSYDYDVYVMALNKSTLHHLAMTDPQFSVVWSPDGSKLLFNGHVEVSGGGQTQNIWTANPDLTGATNLSPTGAWDNYASWSPDGTKIVFSRDSSQIGGADETIWIMNADGSNAMNISNPGGTRGTNGFDSQPTWSPDGSRILFVRFNRASPGTGDIWAVDPDGNNLTQLTSSTLQDSHPLWSPDGTKIYFTRCTTADCPGSDAWVMNADGSNVTQVTTSGTESLGDWNATTTFAGTVSAGTKLITWDIVGMVGGSAQTPQGRLFLEAPDGSNRVALTAANADAQNPQWR